MVFDESHHQSGIGTGVIECDRALCPGPGVVIPLGDRFKTHERPRHPRIRQRGIPERVAWVERDRLLCVLETKIQALE